MTLRSKTLLIFCFTLAGLVSILYAASKLILLSSFAHLEEQRAVRNAKMADGSIGNEVENLDYITRDWAWWDETYAYVADRNEAFEKDNLNDITIAALKLNAIIFINGAGRTVFATGFDPERGERTPLPDGLSEYILSHPVLLRHADERSRAAGIICLRGGPLLIASRPVLTGEGKGPIRGTLVMARALDDAKVEQLSSLTHLSLRIRPFNDPVLPADFLAARARIAAGESVAVMPLSDEIIAGYGMLRDIEGKPCVLTRVDRSRDIFIQGKTAVRYFIAALICAGLVFGAAMLVVLEKMVMARLRGLSSRMDQIAATGDLSARVVIRGKDEISRLAGSFSGMLVALESSQQELRRSEENYRSLFENMLSGFAYHRIVVDEKNRPVDFVFLEINSVFEKLTGLKRDLTVGRRASEVMPGLAGDSFDWISLYGRVAITGETARLERYSKYLGRWYSLSAYSPRQNYFAVIFDDITGRKRMENALRKTQLQQKAILDNIPDIAWLKDTESKFIAVNEPFGKACGVKPEALVGKTDLDIWPRELAERYRADDAEVMRSGARKCVEEPLVDAAGHRTWIETIKTPIYDHEGKVIGTTGIARDITDRKRAEEALRESEEKYRTLWANVPVGLYRNTPGPEGKFLVANPAIVKMFGYDSEEEFLRCSVSDLYMDPSERKGFSEMILERGAVAGIELRLKKKDGTPIWGSVSARVMREEAGGIIYFDGMIEDITARKTAEEALRKTAEDLKRSNEDLEQFAYLASHDLQEPLRMVASYLQLLERRYRERLGGDAGEFIDYAVEGATRMKSLIRDLLEYSRVGTSDRPFEAVDSDRVLDEALSNLEVAIKENDAEITREALPTVSADAKQIVQLFQNLVVNAIKFRSAEKPRIHIAARRRGGEWVFSVRDNGIGIDPKFADRVFIIFQRLHGRDEYPGTGIGLALCRKIVERHGGRIWVESAPGAGATFFFTLPAAKR